ncbi:MAG TPA: hypothetical protein VH475_16775 [Tepidisphaeraceae bacterium]
MSMGRTDGVCRHVFVWVVLSSVVLLSFRAHTARAAPYADTVGEQAGTDDTEVDIAGVVVTRDLANLNFQINLTGDISTANFGNYLVGLQTGPGGSTTLDTPWGKPVGISSGMNTWVGSWVNFGGGAQVYQWDGVAWNLATIGTVTLAANSTTVSLPLDSLGLASGTPIKFDVWSTYGAPGGQSAYDALDNPLTTVPDPWNGTPYDSAGGPLALFTLRDADANSDGVVDFNDLVALAQHYDGTGLWADGDFNGDGVVDFNDLVLLAQHYNEGAGGAGQVVSVPEPGLAGLVGAMVIGLWRRRPG